MFCFPVLTVFSLYTGICFYIMDGLKINIFLADIVSMKCKEKSYHLCLSNGIEWNLTAYHGTGEWLSKLAYIMGLEQTEKGHLPEIIFCQQGDSRHARKYNDSDIGDYGARKIRKGWVAHDLKSIRTWSNHTTSDVICEVGNDGSHALEIVNMWISLQPIYQRVQDGGGLPLHAALLELDGRGILLAAPGNTGKSTSCSRLPDYWNVLGDDEALVAYEPGNGYRVHPFPTWSEYIWSSSRKSWNVQQSVPLHSLFFLEQAENDEVIPLGAGQAAVSINKSATEVARKLWRGLDDETKRPLVKLQFDNACEMAKYIPAFTLRATLHGRFWEEIEKVLKEL